MNAENTKTGMQIEKDFYHIVKDGTIGQTITGTVYRNGTRPNNAQTEDAVVAFLNGLDQQFQSGFVNINIYVPMKLNKGAANKVRNIGRIDTIMGVVQGVFGKGFDESEYMLDDQEKPTPEAMDLDEIGQTLIHTRVKFIRKTF